MSKPKTSAADLAERKKVEEHLRKLYPHGAPDFTTITIDELALHSRKNHEYAQGGDPLGNFYRVGAILSLYPGLDPSDPVVVSLIYSLKQTDAALWMLSQGYEGSVEDIDSRLGDVHVYNKLARVIKRSGKRLVFGWMGKEKR
jgi:hypothetical protein